MADDPAVYAKGRAFLEEEPRGSRGPGKIVQVTALGPHANPPPLHCAPPRLASRPFPQTMLARIQGIFGPFPRWMLLEGEEASKYFTPEGCVYQRMDDGRGEGPLISFEELRCVYQGVNLSVICGLMRK